MTGWRDFFPGLEMRRSCASCTRGIPFIPNIKTPALAAGVGPRHENLGGVRGILFKEAVNGQD